MVNNVSRYGFVAMTLHWLIAMAVILNIGLGLYMSEVLADQDPHRLPILQFHKSIGLTVSGFKSVSTLARRLVNPVPPMPKSLSPRLRMLARVTHFLLYFLIIAIPLSGWALVSTSRGGAATFYFGLFHWPNPDFITHLAPGVKEPLQGDFNVTHVVLAVFAIVLVPLHVAGAFYHLRNGDGVLWRMLPRAQAAYRS